MCDAPLSIRYDPPRPDGKGGFVYWFPADCGKCLPCLIKRKKQWSYRMVQEQRDSFSAYFVTLTYVDSELIWSDDGPTGNKKDHKDFIKWLRYYERKKNLERRSEMSFEEFERKKNKVSEVGKRLKYYGIIEYGDKKGRPHMHYIIYNLVDIGNVNRAWSKQLRISKGVYIPGLQKGRVQVDECNVNTIDYVLKYMVKDRMNVEDKQREVSFMSKGLGLGLVDDEFLKHIRTPGGNTVVNTRGGELAVPRYYKKKFLTDQEREEKRKFVEKQIQEKEIEDERIAKAKGLNLDSLKRNGVENRNNNLRNRKKRNVE